MVKMLNDNKWENCNTNADDVVTTKYKKCCPKGI